MTNPQLTESLLAVIRSLPSEDRQWLLSQLEQDRTELGHCALAQMAMAGGSFADLAAEPELYSFSDGEAIGAG
jgi:hypothetical protein